jgi:lanosterol synthase
MSFYSKLQTEDGHWACEYGGPMFLIPGLVIAMYIAETPMPNEWRTEMISYIIRRANPVDGGWGVHTHHFSTVFGTTLNYVALRLLGVSADHPATTKARNRLHELGGAIGVPHWGKFWLCALGIYEWEGINPIPPELWYFLYFCRGLIRLLPDWFPIHPHKWWIHVRNVYIPMSYVFRRRLSMPLHNLTKQIRDEIYIAPYDSYRFSEHRNTIAPGDMYNPHNTLLNGINWVITQYENYCFPTRFSDAAVARVWELICAEDDNTDFLCVGPVNQALHLLATYYAVGKDHYRHKRHVERLPDFMFLNHEGMLMNGTNGCQLWDTAFTVSAAFEADLAGDPEFIPVLTKALEFIDDMQVLPLFPFPSPSLPNKGSVDSRSP